MTSLPPQISGYAAFAECRRLEHGSQPDPSAPASGEHPLVSVITPVFNRAGSIERCIASVLAQTYSNLEYIVIDGGSTDGTVELVRSRGEAISFWCSEPDAGISDAFNKGIASARGSIIAILNSDDWYEKDAIQIAVEGMRRTGCDVFVAALRCWRRGVPQFVQHSNLHRLRRENTINHPSAFVLRSAYERWGLYRTEYRVAMDYEFFLRLHAAGAHFEISEKVTSNMLLGEGQSERHRYRGFAEMYRAKVLHGGSRVGNACYTGVVVARMLLRVAAERLHFHALLRRLRGRFTVMRTERISHHEPPLS